MDESGVLVLNGARVIARLRCREGGGQFAHGYAYDALPADGEELVAAKWDRNE